jgi:glutathione synthase/RimK-type ligase-like ATP-grasp enzyme
VIRVAVATCEGEDVDPDSPRLLQALDAHGMRGQLCVWDDPSVDWDAFDLTVVRSTWNYAARRNEFLDWARSIRHLMNPYEVIEYSTDKHYLADLASRGHRVVPSTFCDVGATPNFPDGPFVVKPCVGAGSMDVERYGAGQYQEATRHVRALHAAERDVLIQPYVASVEELGERALVFIGGLFSHAMTKGAMLNVTALDRHALYRREQMSLATGEPDAVAYATHLLGESRFAGLLYGRVDLVRLDGEWALMELELAEPSLFLGFDERAGDRFAQAIRARIS